MPTTPGPGVDNRLPDFATIRTIRERQVLITRGTDQDEDTGEDQPAITITFDLRAGARSSMTMGFPDEETRDEAWDRCLAGGNDQSIAETIDQQEKQFGGMIVPKGEG